MKKIYIVTAGEYSDYHICGVFSSMELAEKLKFATRGSGIEEYEIDIVYNYPPGKKYYWCSMFKNGTVEWVYQYDNLETYNNGNTYEGNGKFYFQVWAKDEKEVIKICNERRVQMIASGETEIQWEEFTENRI